MERGVSHSDASPLFLSEYYFNVAMYGNVFAWQKMTDLECYGQKICQTIQKHRNFQEIIVKKY